jgi:hypothetical protein
MGEDDSITLNDDGQPICPSCNEIVDKFSRIGKRNFVTCPNGCRIGTSRVPSEIMDSFVEVTGPSMPSKPLPPVNIQRPSPPKNVVLSEEDVLLTTLRQCGVNERGQEILLRRVQRNGYVSSAEIVSACMVSGSTKNKDEALYISEEYEMEKMNNEERKEMLSGLRNSGRGSNVNEMSAPQSQVQEFGNFVHAMKDAKDLFEYPRVASGNDGLREELLALRQQLADNEKKQLQQQLDDIKAMVKESKGESTERVAIAREVKDLCKDFLKSDKVGQLSYMAGSSKGNFERGSKGEHPLVPGSAGPVGSHGLKKVDFTVEGREEVETGDEPEYLQKSVDESLDNPEVRDISDEPVKRVSIK